jgi:RNA polymerase sigma factor (sigma-70 family)
MDLEHHSEIDLSDHLSLVHHHACHICRQYNVILSQGYEDLVAEGLVAMAECRARYNPGSGAEFSTFAWSRINGAMLDYLIREGRYAKMHKNSIPSNYANHSIGDQVGAREQLRLLNGAVEKLPYRRKKIMQSVINLQPLQEAAEDVVNIRKARRWRREFLAEWSEMLAA